MATPLDLKTKYNPTWCPGCGDYGLLNSLKAAISEANLDPKMTVIVSGIGCSGKDPHFVKTYGFEGLHGRTLPLATGIKLANHKLNVIACGGDGDGYGIGACHFVHSARRNIGITYFVHNNEIYGLTTGQTSPTSLKGFVTKSTPEGAIESPFNPVAMAITGGATFVARTYVAEFDHIKYVMKEALLHKGFALVDIFQPCVTFNNQNTYEWFKERVYKLEDDKSYDPKNKLMAIEKALSNHDRIPIGIFYRESRPTYEDEVSEIKDKVLAGEIIDNIDISKTVKEFY